MFCLLCKLYVIVVGSWYGVVYWCIVGDVLSDGVCGDVDVGVVFRYIVVCEVLLNMIGGVVGWIVVCWLCVLCI